VATAGAAAKRAAAAAAAGGLGWRKRPRRRADALVVGVLPNISARKKLMAQYEHMKHILEGLTTQKISNQYFPQFQGFLRKHH